VPGGAGCTHGAHSPVGAQTVREPDRWLGGNALRADNKIAHQAPTSGPADLPFIEHGARIKRAAACKDSVLGHATPPVFKQERTTSYHPPNPW
jgi:hypothetical protein